VNVALAALATFDVVFEVRVACSGGGNFGGCSGRERSAAEICVQDDASGVDDRDERRCEEGVDVLDDARFDRGSAWCCGRGGGDILLKLVAQFGEAF